jgi:hypothetical protein
VRISKERELTFFIHLFQDGRMGGIRTGFWAMGSSQAPAKTAPRVMPKVQIT